MRRNIRAEDAEFEARYLRGRLSQLLDTSVCDWTLNQITVAVRQVEDIRSGRVQYLKHDPYYGLSGMQPASEQKYVYPETSVKEAVVKEPRTALTADEQLRVTALQMTGGNIVQSRRVYAFLSNTEVTYEG